MTGIQKRETTDVLMNEKKKEFFSGEFIRYKENPYQKGELICKIISNPWFISEDVKIKDLALELTDRDEIRALGVVNSKGRVLGIIHRTELFNLLGRPFGLDVLQKRPVGEILKRVERFHYQRNAFSVADIIGSALTTTSEDYFLLHDEFDKFVGIFSSLDMLLYLSNMTRMDIAMGRELQQRLVKAQDSHEHRDFSLVSASRMAKGIGGDINFISHGEEKTIAVICDVSGKGVGAAMVTASIWPFFSSFTSRDPLSSLIFKLDSYIYRTFQGERFMTGLFVSVDPVKAKLKMYDMGHSLVFLFRDEKLHALPAAKTQNAPLGVFGQQQPVPTSLQLRAGDIFFSCTDGFIEQTNSEGERYSMKRLEQIILNYYHNSLEKLNEVILQDFYTFRGFQAQHDDVTILLLKYHPRN